MSKDELSSGQPERDKQEIAPPADAPQEKRAIQRVEMMAADDDDDDDDDDDGSDSVTGLRGIRLMAWLLGIVLVLAILGWALGSR